MMATKQKYGKLGGNVAYHGYQSFREGEVTPEEAHIIGLETAKQMWGDYEVVVTTHLNTDNIHNHFVVNSVSFKTGKKFENHIRDHRRLREISDLICFDYGKSFLTNAPFYSNEKKFYWLRKNRGLSSLDKFREDADMSRGYARDFYDYYNNLIYLGYKFYNPRYTNYEYVIVPGFKTPVKLSSLGEEYTFYGFKPKEQKELVIHHVIRIFKESYPNRTMWDSLYSLWKTILDFIEYFVTKNRETGKVNVPLSPELRKELKDFEKIHKEYLFIKDNNIFTFDDLAECISKKTDDLSELINERQRIYNRCRRPKSEDDLELNKAKARELSKEIRILRAEIKYAKALPERENTLMRAMAHEFSREYPGREINYER